MTEAPTLKISQKTVPNGESRKSSAEMVENEVNSRLTTVRSSIHEFVGFYQKGEQTEVPQNDKVVYVIGDTQFVPESSSQLATTCFNSLGVIKLVEMILAGAALGCIWYQCQFSHYYNMGYCYGPESAFQMQNFPVAACIGALILNLVVLISWISTYEQPNPVNNENSNKRQVLAKVDTFIAGLLLLFHVSSVFIEAWMTIKFNQEFSCATCYKLALWSIATVILFFATAAYVWNLVLCNQQQRLEEIAKKRF